MNLLCVSYVARYNRIPYLYRVLVFGMLDQPPVAQVSSSVTILPSPVMSPPHLSLAMYTPFYVEHRRGALNALLL